MNQEQKIVRMIRSRLHNRGVSGVSAEIIKEALVGYDIENLSEDQKALIVDQLVKHGIPLTEDAPKEDDAELAVLFSGKSNDDEVVDMVKQESELMGVRLNVNDINTISTKVQSLSSFKSDKIGAIKKAILAFIDYQHQKSSNEVDEMISEIKDHATKEAVSFNNRMVGDLSDFFRDQEQDFNSDVEQLLQALQSYR